MSGEIDVAGMQAGMVGTSFGYEMLLEVILIFHMGLKFTTLGVLDPGEGNFHPDCFALGFERGQGMNVNLLRGWDWLRAMGEQLSDLRAEYQIEAVPVIDMPAPKEH